MAARILFLKNAFTESELPFIIPEEVKYALAKICIHESVSIVFFVTVNKQIVLHM